MRFMAICFAVGCAALVAVTIPAFADQRDDALKTVRALSNQVAARLAAGQLDEASLWAGVQGLSDAFYRFTLAETERRSEEKVGPPLIASLRPGQGAPIENTQPGERTALSSVPRAWFNKTVSDSQEALDHVRSLLESGAGKAEIVPAIAGFDASLDLIDRPPSP